MNSDELEKAFEYIEEHKEVWEVILSGGDPLVLNPQKLSSILKRLEKIPHIGTIRIHTRVPLVAPEKITPQLLKVLDITKALFVVLHCNSDQELVDEVKSGISKLSKSGIPLLSQSVLLKGINDSSEKLEILFRKLTMLRVKPYYLHHADLAEGTSHFRTSIETGVELMKELRGNVSGICQPHYVLDIPGGHGKVPLGPQYIEKNADSYDVEDWQGFKHVYKDIITDK